MEAAPLSKRGAFGLVGLRPERRHVFRVFRRQPRNLLRAQPRLVQRVLVERVNGGAARFLAEARLDGDADAAHRAIRRAFVSGEAEIPGVAA